MTIADQIRQHPKPYERAVALMSGRDRPWAGDTVTFHFADDSQLTFNITYTVAEDPADKDRPLTELAQDVIDKQMCDCNQGRLPCSCRSAKQEVQS